MATECVSEERKVLRAVPSQAVVVSSDSSGRMRFVAIDSDLAEAALKAQKERVSGHVPVDPASPTIDNRD